jgi:hypothetical protein
MTGALRRARLMAAAFLGLVAIAGCDDAGGVDEPSPATGQRQSHDDGHAKTTPEAKPSRGFVTGEDGVKTWAGPLVGGHVLKPVKYPTSPPVGGPHHPTPLNCNGDVYTRPVKNENAVHSLEHGAVWVTYTSRAAKSDVKALAAKVRKTPYTMMSPYKKQKHPIMLTAWGHQRTVTAAKDPNVAKFFEKYVQGEQTPEPGAPCTGGTME